ncbi:hypothetical protein BJ741DRAFT_714884 [Chytriomyces cf. hyalinus JEL632]|nr:hypothetical protein BJ741DRAFT_714884 [Chytriomyces cf. hyalinus JEL632]
MDRTLSLFSSAAGTALSTNDTLDAAPKTYPTTGFVYVYVWSGLDNASWCAFLMYQLYYSFVILNEAALNHKPTFIWLIVFVAIACNMMASVSGFFLLDCFTFNLTPDPHICDGKAHVYYFLGCVCYCIGFFLLFYRKLKVVPETIGYPGAVDLVVLLGCCGLNLAADVPCLYKDINTCFLQDVYQASAGGLSFLYFDAWFLVCVTRKTFEKGSKWEVLQLCALTGSMTLVYLAGSISYKTWGGNFYTNIIWNMGYCVLPLYCIDSVVSPKFLKLFAKEKSITRPSEAGSRPTGASIVSKATPGNTALTINKSVI